MILPDYELVLWAIRNVKPFNLKHVNPASIDLCLSSTIRLTPWYWNPISRRLAHKLNLPRWTKPMQFDQYLLKPGEFVLCSSLETTRIPDNMVAILFSKSSTGRRGIEHLHAGYGDPGFGDNEKGGATWTWELCSVAPWPNLLEAGKPLMQLALARLTDAPMKTYKKTGRYNEQKGPQPEILEIK